MCAEECPRVIDGNLEWRGWPPVEEVEVGTILEMHDTETTIRARLQEAENAAYDGRYRGARKVFDDEKEWAEALLKYWFDNGGREFIEERLQWRK
jgi:hypothetical protein